MMQVTTGAMMEVTMVRGGGYRRDSSIHEGGAVVTKIGRVTSANAHDAIVDFPDGDFQTVPLGCDERSAFPVMSARVVG